MSFPYKKILKQAWQLTWKYKFLWALGLFLLGSSNQVGINHGPNWRVGNTPATLEEAEALAQNLLNNSGLLAAIALAIVVVVFLAIFLGSVARGGVIFSMDKFSERDPAADKINLRTAIKQGYKHVWQLVGIRIASFVALLFAAVILVLPVYYLDHAGLDNRALLLAGVAFIIFIPLLVLISLVVILASNFIVIAKLNMYKAVAAGFDLLMRRLTTIITLGLLTLLVDLLFFLLLGAVLAGVFPAVRMVAVDMAQNISIASIALSFGVVFVAVVLVQIFFTAVASVWHLGVWTLAWKELVSREKAEETEAKKVVAPETA